jgi:hypothetical protein
LLTVIVRFALKDHPQTVETYYSRGMYPFIQETLSLPARIIPLPYCLSEIFVYLFVTFILLYTLYQFAVTIYKKQTLWRFFLKKFFQFLTFSVAVFVIVQFIWCWNYFRIPFGENICTDQKSLSDIDSGVALAYDMAGIANRMRNSSLLDKKPSIYELNAKVDSGLNDLMEKYNVKTNKHIPAVKHFVMNEFFSKTGISGLFFPLFLEPVMDSELCFWEKPQVMAHEKAHFLGFASESDANLVAFITCLQSDSPWLQYSGSLSALLTYYGRLPEEVRKDIFENRLTQKVKNDIKIFKKRIFRNWEKKERTIKYAKKINDSYLKLNNQKMGIGSYRHAINYLAVWWMSRKLQPAD